MPADGALSPARGSAAERLSPYDEILGTVPDRVISQKTGVSVRTILMYRRKRGIPAYDRHRGGRSQRGRGGTPKPAGRGVVSGVSSAVIAALPAPVSVANAPEAAAIAPAKAPRKVAYAANGRPLAWRVAFDTNGESQSCIVVANTLAEAAARVVSALSDMTVRRIEYLGATL